MRLTIKRLFAFGVAAMVGLIGCSENNPRVRTTLNHEAALTEDLPENPLNWKIVTSAINNQDSTMYILFGNDVAIQSARSAAQSAYPAGSVLSLVTWKQQEDARWFGGNIPASVRSVEFVTVALSSDHQVLYSYQDYEGSPLKKVSSESSPTAGGRAGYLLAQRAAVMP